MIYTLSINVYITRSGGELLLSANGLFGDAMNQRWTAEELKYLALVAEAVERERDRYERKIKRPLTGVDRVRFEQWQARYEAHAWEGFYGPPVPIHGGKP